MPSKIFSSSDEQKKALQLVGTTELGGEIFNSLGLDDTIRYVELINADGPDLAITGKEGSGTRIREGTDRKWYEFWKPIPRYKPLYHYRIALNMNVEDPTFVAFDKSRFTPSLTRVVAHELGHIAVNEGYIRNKTVIQIENEIYRELNPAAPIRHPTLEHK